MPGPTSALSGTVGSESQGHSWGSDLLLWLGQPWAGPWGTCWVWKNLSGLEPPTGSVCKAALITQVVSQQLEGGGSLGPAPQAHRGQSTPRSRPGTRREQALPPPQLCRCFWVQAAPSSRPFPPRPAPGTRQAFTRQRKDSDSGSLSIWGPPRLRGKKKEANMSLPIHDCYKQL